MYVVEDYWITADNVNEHWQNNELKKVSGIHKNQALLKVTS